MVYFISIYLLFVFSTKTDFILEKKISFPSVTFEVDRFGDFYGVNNNTFFKISNNTSERINYSNNLLGKPQQIDVRNPLQLILYYKNNNTLIYLNNTLDEIRSPISLDDLEFYNSGLICSSNLGGIWFYDHFKKRLYYINKYLEIEIESVDLETIIQKIDAPNYLIESQSKVYLNIPNKSILEFNQNGELISKINILTQKVIAVQNENIFYLHADSLGSYHILTKNNYIVPLPENNFSDIKIQNKKIYIFMDNSLSIYKIIN